MSALTMPVMVTYTVTSTGQPAEVVAGVPMLVSVAQVHLGLTGGKGDKGDQGVKGDVFGNLDGGTATSAAPTHLIFNAGGATP